MKKATLLIALAAITISSVQARIKSIVSVDTTQTSTINTPFIKLPASDFRKLVSTASDYKSQLIYNPFLSGDEKTNMQITYDRYLFDLKKSTKVDSVLTLSAADYQKLVSIASDFKSQIIYNPFLSGDEKTNLQISFDRYIYNLKKASKSDNAIAARTK